jgi:DNA polymerase III delta prime subunit
MSTPPWIEQLLLELRRGRHVLLTGNVADAYPVDGSFVLVTDAVRWTLRNHGCAVVAVHDIADGMTFETAEEQEWFERAYSDRHGGDRVQPRADPATDAGREAEEFGRAVARRRTRRFQAPLDALAATRLAIVQRRQQLGVIFNLAELTFSGGEHPSHEELRPLAELAHAVRDASFLPAEDGTPPRNAIILISASPSAALSRYVANEPQIATIEIGLPAVAERRTYLEARIGGFFGADGIDEEERARHAEALTRLTDGLHAWDLEALRRTSFSEEAPITSPRALTSRFALGRRASPWDETAATVFAEAYDRLSTDVLGQEVVVEMVCQRLIVARHGVGFDDESGRRHRRPRATFFFAGPTGVGKTELAKALARLLFGDEAALITFDMTEYRDRASAARLTGSDPGFVGFEEGGQLVNAVRARPFSILLFDEIEKAHPSVLDLFIGILDEGRLTDGHGRTASFADTIVIFTSNAGSDRLAEKLNAGEPLRSDQVRALFVKAVEDKLTLPAPNGIGRPELLGRMRGGVIGFDLLRPELLDRLTTKFLNNWRANVLRIYAVEVDLDEAAFFRLVQRRLGTEVLRSGARTLETQLRDLIDQPLAEAVARNALPPGSRLVIAVDEQDDRARFTVRAPHAAEVA